MLKQATEFNKIKRNLLKICWIYRYVKIILIDVKHFIREKLKLQIDPTVLFLALQIFFCD